MAKYKYQIMIIGDVCDADYAVKTESFHDFEDINEVKKFFNDMYKASLVLDKLPPNFDDDFDVKIKPVMCEVFGYDAEELDCMFECYCPMPVHCDQYAHTLDRVICFNLENNTFEDWYV